MNARDDGFKKWDEAHGEATWNGGRRSLTDQYLIVWRASRDALLASVEDGEGIVGEWRDLISSGEFEVSGESSSLHPWKATVVPASVASAIVDAAAARIVALEAELERVKGERDSNAHRSEDAWQIVQKQQGDILALQNSVESLRTFIEKPPRHKYWGAGEADCPKEIKGGNGELHTLRCKVCGLNSPLDEICRAAHPETP